MQPDAVSYHRVLINLWKPFLALVGGPFVLRSLKRGLYRAPASLRRNSLFAVGAPHMIGRFGAVVLHVPLALIALRVAGFPATGVLATFAGLLAVLGAGMVAVRTIPSAITATVFMLMRRPYPLGQHVEALPDGVKGEVPDNALVYAGVQGSRGRAGLVPNGPFFQKGARRLPLPVRSTVMASPRLRAGGVGDQGEGRAFGRGSPVRA